MNFNQNHPTPYGSKEWYIEQIESSHFYKDDSSGFLQGLYAGYIEMPSQPSSLGGQQYVFGPIDQPIFGKDMVPDDPLKSFFASKERILAKSVEDIVGLIYERESIKQDHFNQILYNECQVMTKLYELDHWTPGTNMSVEHQRTTFERELLNFDREKRMEDVACWRDVTRLKGDLREAITKIEEEKRKQNLINGDAQ